MDVQNFGVLPTNTAEENSANWEKMMALSPEARLYVNHILSLAAKEWSEEAARPIHIGVGMPLPGQYFMSHHYPIMKEFDHETGELDADGNKIKVKVMEEAWVHVSPELYEEVKAYLESESHGIIEHHSSTGRRAKGFAIVLKPAG